MTADAMPRNDCPNTGRHFHPGVSAGYRGGGKGYPVLVECTPYSRWLSHSLFPWWDKTVMDRLPEWAGGLLLVFWPLIPFLILGAVMYFVVGVNVFDESYW
jgi:hypothetical protein